MSLHSRAWLRRAAQQLIGGILVAAFAGCAAPPRPTYNAPAAPAAKPAAPTKTHQYGVTVVDLAGTPMPGVPVEVVLDGKGTAAKTVQCTTDDNGKCPVISYEVQRDPQFTYSVFYNSSAKAKASKVGFYDASAQGTGSDSRVSEMRLRMLRPTDYLEDGFAQSAADKELRERVLKFLDAIRLQGILNDAEVMLKGVGTSEFKGKKYLRLRVNSTTTFNSLKLNKYDMGKRHFDDSVRKLLSPLNDFIAAPKAYYGYDIVVYGHTKSFAQEYATPTKVEYRFLLPETAVRRYKDKDISGQALLDAGVTLMDDERVEFKLQ